MKILMMAPEKQGYIVEDSYDQQLVVAVLEDDGIEVALIVDTLENKYYINEIIDKNAIWKFSSHNFKKVESDDAFDAYEKFFFDNDLGLVLSGMAYARTGKIEL